MVDEHDGTDHQNVFVNHHAGRIINRTVIAPMSNSVLKSVSRSITSLVRISFNRILS